MYKTANKTLPESQRVALHIFNFNLNGEGYTDREIMFHTNGLWLFCPREHPKRSNKRMTGFSDTNKFLGHFDFWSYFDQLLAMKYENGFGSLDLLKSGAFVTSKGGSCPHCGWSSHLEFELLIFLSFSYQKKKVIWDTCLFFLESQAHILMFLFSLFQKHLIIFCCSKWRDGQIVFETGVAWNCGVFAENPFKSKWGRFEVGGAIFGPGLLDFKQTSMICSNIEIPQFLGWN